MIMSNEFQFQYANPCSLPYISYKMNYASIILDAIRPSNFVVDNELFFFLVRHLKIKEKIINLPSSAQIFVDKWRHLARY